MHIIIGSNSFIIAIGISEIIKKINPSLTIRIATNKEQFIYLLKHLTPNLVIITSDFGKYIKNIDLQKVIVIKNDKTKIKHYLQIIDINASQKHILDLLKPYFYKSSENGENQKLSSREIEVLRLIALGYTTKEIADRLFISEHTVNTHRKNISQKLGIKTISGLTLYAVINGIVEISQS